MADFYETIRKSMFAYFCKHHSNIIEEKFAVPRKVKIAKKSHKTQHKRYYLSDKTDPTPSSIQINCDHVEEFNAVSQMVIDNSVLGNTTC